jgi:hypothetical protein
MFSFTPRPFYPRVQKIEGWMGPRARLDAVAKRKFPIPDGNRILVFQAVEDMSFEVFTTMKIYVDVFSQPRKRRHKR